MTGTESSLEACPCGTEATSPLYHREECRVFQASSLAPKLPRPFYEDDLCTIYNGDSREILPLLAADVMVTDPPYGIAHHRTTGNFTNGRIATVGISIVNDLDTTARDEVLAAWSPRPAVVFGSPLIPAPPTAKQALVWHKSDGGAGVIGNVRGWRRDWEPVYLCGEWPVRHDQDSSVIPQPVARIDAGMTGHPHTKPLPLMRRLMEKCPPGVIVDPFMGSGSTLRAAKDLGRKCIGIELDVGWCNVAAERCAQEVLDVA